MAKGDAAGVPDFTDREAAEIWLRTQPRDVSVVIAARAALRVALKAGSAMVGYDVAENTAVILPALRAGAVAWFVATGRNRTSDFQLQSAAASAARAARVARSETYHLADDDATASAAYAAAASTAAEAYTAAGYSAAIYGAAYAAAADAAATVGGASPRSLACSPLWPDGLPEWAQSDWANLKSLLLAADEGWEVWTDWYEARLRGDPFDPDLELARVLIDDAIWRQGPRAVNAEIARLIAEHRAKAHNELIVRIAALEATIAALKHEGSERGPDVPPGLGHNNPPEAIDEVAEELQDNLEVLKAQPPTPNDPAAAMAAVAGLKATLSRLTSFTGEKLDLFITEASKEGGKKFGAWAVRLAALGVGEWALDLSVKLAQVLDAAIIWVRSLGVPI